MPPHHCHHTQHTPSSLHHLQNLLLILELLFSFLNFFFFLFFFFWLLFLFVQTFSSSISFFRLVSSLISYKKWSLRHWFALFNCGCHFNSCIFRWGMIRISNKSHKISVSGIDLSGGAWNKKSIGVFPTKELEDSKLCFAGVTAFLLNEYILLHLKPAWIMLKSIEQFQANLNKLAKLYWLITQPVKWLNVLATLFHPAFNGLKTNRSRGCNKCDECAGWQ